MKIKDLRSETKQSQEAMAREIGVSLVTVGLWERGGKKISDLSPLAQKAVEGYARKHKVKFADGEGDE